MGMIDTMKRDSIDNSITFIFFIRIDNKARQENIEFVSKFYQKHLPKSKIIFIEEIGFRPDHLVAKDVIDIRSNDVYVDIPVNDGDLWNKCAGYNRGISIASTPVIVFNDVDAVIQPQQIRLTAESILSGESDVMYPYNGEWLCVDNNKIKYEFGQTLDYQILDNNYPDFLLNSSTHKPNFINYVTTNGILFGHWNSRGGCVMGNREKVIEGGGYNPFFEGWGYEDDEFPVRMNKLRYNVTRLNSPRMPCWHLTHAGNGQSEKETQPHHQSNRSIVSSVEKMTYDELKQYIKKWEIS